MSKIICEECNKEIDDTTKQCPNCGYKNKQIQIYTLKSNNVINALNVEIKQKKIVPFVVNVVNQ